MDVHDFVALFHDREGLPTLFGERVSHPFIVAGISGTGTPLSTLEQEVSESILGTSVKCQCGRTHPFRIITMDAVHDGRLYRASCMCIEVQTEVV